MARTIRLVSTLILVALAHAGVGGVNPNAGHYKFYRTDPTPEATVGSGHFSGSNSASVVTSGGASRWEREAPPTGDGQFRRTDQPNGPQSFCIIACGCGALYYDFKVEDEVVSSGYLIPI